MTLCPCHSNAPYNACCKVYHKGQNPENALKLMRSRYSAYALSLFDYIMETTDPSNPSFSKNQMKWRKELKAFVDITTFKDLEIIEFIDGEHEAYVTFRAILEQQGFDASFTEKSAFLKKKDKWFYKSGQWL